VDALEVERENGRRLMAERRERALAPPTPADPAAARWVERGSENQAGRMHVARHSIDGGALVAGSALGGVWRGDLGGGDWTPLGDGLYGGAHWLEVLGPDSPGGPEVLMAATDWGQVHRSADDGLTWTSPSGLDGLYQVRRLLFDSSDGSTLYLMAADYWNGSWLLRSQDGGLSFSRLRTLSGYWGDVWSPRDGSPGLYMVDQNQLLRSNDQGDSWTELGRIGASGNTAEIVGSEAGAPRLWVAGRDAEGNALLFRSDDAGSSFDSGQSISDYWSALNASMEDPDLFAFGGVELHITRDGGASWGLLNAWWDYYEAPAIRLHADMMGVDVLPGEEGELWYISTDGGLYVSEDRLGSVQNLSLTGLRVSQYYSTLTSREEPSQVAAGAQDQGYQITLDLEMSGDRYNFDQVLSGDYGHLSSTGGTHDLVYSVYPGFVLIHAGRGGAATLFYADFPAGESMAWLPPVVAHPTEEESFFLAARHLYRYDRVSRDTWEFTLWSDEDFAREEGEYLSALTFSPTDPERAWAATNLGHLYWSEDGGQTWTLSEDGGPDAHYFYGTALLASHSDPDLLWVGGSGYGEPAVYQSEDGGRTWEAHGEGLPSTLVYSLCESPDGDGTLLAGTETSAWRRERGESSWINATGLAAPLTIYWSCETLWHENTIRFGTYGRGIWDYQLDPENQSCWPVQDADADGINCDSDCDDADPAVGLGEEEICGDGIDQDCNGADLACDEDSGTGEGSEVGGDGVDGSDGAGGSGGSGGAGKGGCACDIQDSGAASGLILAALALARRRRLRPGA
jgi:photosystem II stability/assembly factor-like uncharacterized protein